MGKKQRAIQNKKRKEERKKLKVFPFVSLCTPTYNRRPFIKGMIQCFEHQTYPKDRMEWVIIDDGMDKIGNLVEHIPQVKYISLETKIPLGKKRNMLHQESKGEIIVYMDDDDYYPPERVEHAVSSLLNNRQFKIAGSSILHIYFNHDNSIYRFGPYGKYHSTAATFAFWRTYIEDSHFDDDACLAEEKLFLKNYQEPLFQLDSLKSILVFSHEHNTFDKRVLLDNYEENELIHKSSLKLNKYISNKDIIKYYTDEVVEELKMYELGTLQYKPDVVAQKEKIDAERKKRREAEQKKHRKITIQENGKTRELVYHELVDVIEKLQSQIKESKVQFNKLHDMYVSEQDKNKKLSEEMETLKQSSRIRDNISTEVLSIDDLEDIDEQASMSIGTMKSVKSSDSIKSQEEINNEIMQRFQSEDVSGFLGR